MKKIDGGICAPKGFVANGVHCGIRKNKLKRDLSLIVSEVRASASSVYTLNLVKGAPIYVTKANIADGYAQAIICNSGNANTCNANGIEIANQMCQLVEEISGISAKDVIVASTGVIGQPLSIEPIKNGLPILVAGLANNLSELASEGIMTTDTFIKQVAVEFLIGDKVCRIGGIAKGSGMIHPNMATMLVFITTDVSILPSILDKVLKKDVESSFNMVSVDGDTSTNDMVSVLANGLAGNQTIDKEGIDMDTFAEALANVTKSLCKMIAKDGEGATKLLECKIHNAPTEEDAKMAAKSVITSSLFKAAMFGSDANWGRVLCALGYSKANLNIEAIDVKFMSASGEVIVCQNGRGVAFSEELAKKVLLESEIKIDIDCQIGKHSATAWGCDLTYDYVKINGDYRT